MKVSGFWALLMVFVTTLTYFNFSSSLSCSWFPDLVSANCDDSSTMISVNRKLKENGSVVRSNKKGDIGHVTLDDYEPIDPVPSSKASIKPGPIEHGTPLMPFIPKPSPPPHPNAGGST